jgi:hypothetical protein
LRMRVGIKSSLSRGLDPAAIRVQEYRSQTYQTMVLSSL